MTYSTWPQAHKKIAGKILRREKALDLRSNAAGTLPELSTDTLKWMAAARPKVEGKQRSFLAFPFWEEIYKDSFPFKMIVGGRQIFKSTYITDMLACEATSRENVQVGYVTFNQRSQMLFSRQKLMVGTFSQNPVLEQFPRHKTENLGEISLKNGSTIYCTISGKNYRNIEGKSLDHCILDEAQYQPMWEAQRVIQTMMATKGKLTIAGIGGESGSAYEEFWNNTDQREWVYDDPNWRDKLQFDQNGLVIGPYLVDVLKGRWVSQRPDNISCHGYHIPQTIFPTIPDTIDDAILRYRTQPMFSIEYQRKNNPKSFFSSNVLGEFFRSDARPVTLGMVLSCMKPYKYLGFLVPEDAIEYRELYQDRIKISLGVDFGSGHPSSTVIAILVQWTLNNGQKRLYLGYIERRSPENQLEQAWYINQLFKEYRCDIGVGDLGYGAIQVKIIQDGGFRQKDGTKFSGVGSDRFIGCRIISDETKPLQRFDGITDEHGDRSSRLEIDKSSAIQEFIDTLNSYVVHPKLPDKRAPKLMIPNDSFAQSKLGYIPEDFTSITRKDLLRGEDDVDPRQRTRMEFNHPKDSVMAMIYALKGLELNQRWA